MLYSALCTDWTSRIQSNTLQRLGRMFERAMDSAVFDMRELCSEQVHCILMDM